jgi:hypothetical protein
MGDKPLEAEGNDGELASGRSQAPHELFEPGPDYDVTDPAFPE